MAAIVQMQRVAVLMLRQRRSASRLMLRLTYFLLRLEACRRLRRAGWSEALFPLLERLPHMSFRQSGSPTVPNSACCDRSGWATTTSRGRTACTSWTTAASSR